ncbi:MAG: ECF-type sigma factor, partial [Planctomycetota bacterium]
MNQSAANSVSLWIQDLKQGREDAAAALWGRYFDRLVILAKHRLGNSEKRVADEEDLAATVFYALCDGAANGRFK